ncbi:hypothetical protein BCV69DRAFT_272183 [Microstroma glucosiphilum]|uniref:Chromatin-remodeling ATPase INO80 n=1 Tax=Pseudomicrostroma glucosiphilum TaxID=1684307 RepID=A0A316U2R5_9BASI|nr:hypothetical protein BCV69DRAFT_272183 [Pseudomicrostroma glucosiphilum]PWN19527.1 hypothetical protein BCV69DRAFT_272183 [Pseudomicrostroma glucosiphilum]
MSSPQHRAYQGQAGASSSGTGGHSSYHGTNGRHISDSPPPAPRPMMSISSILNDGGSVPKSPGINRAPAHVSHTSHSATSSHSMAGPSSPPHHPSKAPTSSPPSAQGRSGSTWATHATPSRLPAPHFRDQHQHPSEQSHSVARSSASSASASGTSYPRADYSGSQAPALAAPTPVSSASSEVMPSSNGNGSYHPAMEEGHRTYSSSEAGSGGRSDQLHGQVESSSSSHPDYDPRGGPVSTSAPAPRTGRVTSIKLKSKASSKRGTGEGHASRRSSQAVVAPAEVVPEVNLEFPTEENNAIWQDELNAYRVRQQLRLQEIEKADSLRWTEDHFVVQKRLEKGYETRFSVLVRKAEETQWLEQQREAERQRARREAARKRKEREVDRELLSMTGGGKSSSKSKAKSGIAVEAEQEHAEASDDDATASGERKGPSKKGRVGESDSSRNTPFKGEETLPSGPEPLEPGETLIDPDGPALPLDEKRIKQLEEAHRRIWTNLARREIPKVYRVVQATQLGRNTYTKRIAVVVQREARRGQTRHNKSVKDVQQRAKKAMREMLLFWRRNEKEEKELRRKAEKEAADRIRREEEMREAKRQARKLNFLITQTELYSHFVGNKLRTAEAEESEETSGGGAVPGGGVASGSAAIIDPSAASTDAPASVPPVNAKPVATSASGAAAEVDAANSNGDLKDIDFDDDDESNLRAHAAKNAQQAILAAREKAQAFDAVAAEERRKLQEAAEAADASGKRIDEKDIGKAFDSDDLNFQNPTSMGQMNISQPKMLTCQLKEYQLKGLNWLANLYEQGINGILADEMGLGKTVQSISLMSYLAEVHDIWGPFLVIAPSSTLHNWQQEITKFTPSLKALPYWGNVKDRAILRKFWSRKHTSYNRDSPFHVLITSYQLVVSDEQYFKRVKWQYMILDEAQAIKSSSSTRWKTLLSFNCRNRLLLTGTPVQNSMQELWALLHFIMPSLFDSHDEFSEWFSKDIEGHAENKGTLNEGQLRRLHMILKPFMLRRIKKNVQNELGDKIEIDVLCEMSARQKMLYRGLRENVSIAELMDRASNLQDEAGIKHLMNLVMQFRKVCNHPELFERADVTGPLSFASFAHSASLTREGDLLHCPDSVTNGIELRVPKLLAREGGLTKTPGWNSRAGFDTKYLDNMFNIWRQPHVADDLRSGKDSAFSALRLLDLDARDAEVAFWGHSAQSAMETVNRETRMKDLQPYVSDDDFSAASVRPFGWVQKSIPTNSGLAPSILPPLNDVRRVYSENSPLAGPAARLWAGKVVAPPIRAYSNDRPFVEEQERMSRDDLVTQMLYGVPTPAGCEDEKLVEATRRALPKLPPRGILTTSSAYQLPAAQMQVPQINKLIIDSTKLAHLDKLLRDLKANDHRVLIYFQMTKMIDLMEEYLIYRQYKYLRLDGSSKISDRRDMVTDWQTKPELFVFLLSTRAGGLGINLTAADTVVFFDSDWNPSNDQQAMDRAHRLGQTKQVTVYRLITKGTIDERIIKMARNKKEVQDIVVGNKTMNEGGSGGVAKPQEIVSLLMDDDELAEAMLRKRQAEEAATAQGKADVMRETHRKRKANREKALRDGGADGERGSAERTVGWALDDDEDDFFGAKPPTSKIEEIDPAGGSNGAAGGEASAPRGPKAGRVPSQQQRKKRSASGPSSRKKKDKDAEGAEGSNIDKTVEGGSNEAPAEGEASNLASGAPPPAKKPRKSGKKQAAAAAAAAAGAANPGPSADATDGAGAVAAPISTAAATAVSTGEDSGGAAATEPVGDGVEKENGSA